MFPRLEERQHTQAGLLSGGERQMLTLCRTLTGDPDPIMIDAPTEGLAPKIVAQVPQGVARSLNRPPGPGHGARSVGPRRSV